MSRRIARSFAIAILAGGLATAATAQTVPVSNEGPASSAVTPEQHPAIAALLARLADKPPAAHRDDLAALATFYRERASQPPIWTTEAGSSPRALAAIAELDGAADYGLSRDAYRVAAITAGFASADARGEHELAIAAACLAYARQARGGRLDPGQISRLFDMTPQPLAPAAVLATLTTDDVAAALRGFHPRHTGFARLQRALAAARAANAPAETLQRLEVNLERWRWLPADLGAFHVINNLPEQVTRVVKSGEVVFTEKIVIGKASSPTPIMSADMQYVIFHPSWGVPNGIRKNEIGPMLRRASVRDASFESAFEGGSQVKRVLARNDLRVYQNGREIDPTSVAWNSVDVSQFHFTQPPGGRNVLGVVKFRFPNKYDVYMHDTNERHLFGHSVRAYSHGCMRVQNPVALAEVLLANDKGWSADRVRAHVPGGRSADITLSTPVPVHLVYFTATVDDVGKLHTHGDVYGHDARLVSALGSKPIALATAKADGATKRDLRRTAQAPRNRDAVWNPFAGLFSN